MITIALIGSTAFCERARQLVAHDLSLQLHCYEYTYPEEASELVTQVKPCDVLMFSGSLPFDMSRHVTASLDIPVVYLRQDANSLSISLLKALQRGYASHVVSIDYRHPSEWRALWDDLDEQPMPHALELRDTSNWQHVLQFHRSRLEAGIVQFAITSVHAVREQLQREGYAVMHMIDSKASILQLFEQAKGEAMFHRVAASQIAIGFLSHYGTSAERAYLERALEATVQKEEDRYVLYSTIGKVERLLDDAHFSTWWSSLPEDVQLGFGSATTFDAAYRHAQIAYEHERQPRQFYIVTAERKLRGPYPTDRESVHLTVEHPLLVTFAERVKFSPKNVSRIVQYAKLRGAESFTAQDLADHLDVTRRTAERMVKKMLEQRYVRIVGEQTTSQKGRPSALYRFQIQ